MPLFEDMPEWGELATFVPNKPLPVYNWFYYREGFSRNLVFEIVKMFNVREGVMLDPFCGVGTTNLACKEKGIDSIGFDVSPLALFAAKVKTRDYRTEKLEKTLSELKLSKFEKFDRSWIPAGIRRFFNPHTLDDVLFFMREVDKIEDNVIRDFFKLALISTAVRCSYMYKDGSVVKIRKHPVPPLRKVYFARAKRMIHDLKKIKFRPCETVIEKCDARKMKVENETIDFVITSPPYLNKIEYTSVYGVEEFLFFRLPRKPGIRSYIGLHTEPEPLFPELPDVANAYFSDMKRVLSELYRVSKDGAKLAIVVGNGCFPDRVVESDLILSKLAEETGFKLKKIYVLNRRWCMKRRIERVGVMRESLVVFEK